MIERPDSKGFVESNRGVDSPLPTAQIVNRTDTFLALTKSSNTPGCSP